MQRPVQTINLVHSRRSREPTWRQDPAFWVELGSGLEKLWEKLHLRAVGTWEEATGELQDFSEEKGGFSDYGWVAAVFY